jgi:hypothetical protein
MSGDPSLTEKVEYLRSIERLFGGAVALTTAAEQLERTGERQDVDLAFVLDHLRYSAAELAGAARRAQ